MGEKRVAADWPFYASFARAKTMEVVEEPFPCLPLYLMHDNYVKITPLATVQRRHPPARLGSRRAYKTKGKKGIRARPPIDRIARALTSSRK